MSDHTNFVRAVAEATDPLRQEIESLYLERIKLTETIATMSDQRDEAIAVWLKAERELTIVHQRLQAIYSVFSSKQIDKLLGITDPDVDAPDD